MNYINLCKKILYVLPDDIIREITSYFILKIPKSDKRIIMLDYFLIKRNQQTEERFYSDGTFRCHIFSDFHICFSIHYFPRFIEYVCMNFHSKQQTNIRFWMTGKCEEYLDKWTISSFQFNLQDAYIPNVY